MQPHLKDECMNDMYEKKRIIGSEGNNKNLFKLRVLCRTTVLSMKESETA